MADDLLKAALLERAKRELAARQGGASSKPRGWRNDGQTGFREQTMSGVNEGIADMLGTPVDLVSGGINALAGWTNDIAGTSIPAIQDPIGGSASMRRLLAPTIAEDQPQTTGQRYGRRIGHEVGAAVIPAAASTRGSASVGEAATRLAPQIVSAIGGGGGAQLARDLAPDSPLAELVGNVAGSIAAPMAVNALAQGAQRLRSPLGGADPDRVALAEYLNKQGVDVTAGQKTGSDTLRRMEAGTGAGQARLDMQDEQFTRAAMRSIGEDASRATPDAMRRAYDRIGGEFDAVLGNTRLAPTSAEAQRVAQAVDTYNELSPAMSASPLIGNVAERIAEAAQRNQPIDAHTARAWRTRLGKAMTGASDDATRSAASELIDIVDDMTEAALRASGRQDDIARLATARQQYRDFLAIERAAAAAGENAATGILSPARVRSAVAGQGRRSYTQGNRGDLGELARAGAAVLGRPSSSGTAQNLGTAIKVGLGIGGTAISAPFTGAAAPIIGAASAAAPWAANRAVLTGGAQSWLGNQAISPRNLLARGNALTDALRIGGGAVNALAGR